MNQIILQLSPYEPWIRTHAMDQSGMLLADRHYSRQSIGNPKWNRPGNNLVLRTAMGDAVWTTWNGIRDDGLEAWECTIFRNEAPEKYLSSDMIRAAVQVTITEWGELPRDGIITYVAANKVRSTNSGCCFKKAGFKHIGESKVNKLLLFQYKTGMEN